MECVKTGKPFEVSLGRFIDVQAHVERFYCSGHIAGPQNVELVKTLRPGKTYFGHGEEHSRRGMAEAVKKEGFDAEALREGQVIECPAKAT